MVFGENKDWLNRELSFVKREDDYLIDVFSSVKTLQVFVFSLQKTKLV